MRHAIPTYNYLSSFPPPSPSCGQHTATRVQQSAWLLVRQEGMQLISMPSVLVS